MEQTADKPYQNRAFQLLSISTNGLFLFHLSLSLSLIFFILFKKEPPAFYSKLLEIIFTKAYLVFFFVSDLGLFLLLKFKRRHHILQRTDDWLATLLGIKYFVIVLLIILIIFILCLFRGL